MSDVIHVICFVVNMVLIIMLTRYCQLLLNTGSLRKKDAELEGKLASIEADLEQIRRRGGPYR